MKIFFLFIFLININGYVLREEVNGRECKIDFEKKNLYIKWDKNLCDNIKYNNYNLFKFKNCNSMKKTIKKGIKMWSNENENIKISYKKNINGIRIDVYFKDLNENIIGYAYRNCKKELKNGSIILNKKKCYYPENIFCNYNELLISLLGLLFITIHIGIYVILNIYLELDNYYYHLLCVIPIFIIDIGILIYITINCGKCESLKNVIGHEMGHLLGYDHPDKNYYLNWDGKRTECKINKYINKDYDKESIMLSTSNLLRYIKKISINDKLGLYELYPSCKNIEKENINEYINENNEISIILIICYIVIPICLLIIYKIKNLDKN